MVVTVVLWVSLGSGPSPANLPAPPPPVPEDTGR